MHPPNPTLSAIDELIRHGHAKLARRELLRVLNAGVARGEVLAVASLARRCNLTNHAIRLLNPLVRPEPGMKPEASAREKALYAACLIRIGASEEGMEIVDSLEPREVPESLLYKALGLVAQWRYAEAARLFSAYLEQPGVGAYEKEVARVNLAAGLLHDRDFARVIPLLEDIVRVTEAGKYYLLYGNALELSAQAAILQRRRDDALKFLGLAESALGNTDDRDEFYVRKWKAIFDLVFEGADAASLSRVVSLQAEATRRQLWEAVRDLDRFKAMHAGSETLLLRLFFGTPFESFRALLLSEFGREVTLPETYLWTPGHDARPDRHLSIETRELVVSEECRGLKIPKQVQRLLLVLSSDFYRPFRLPELHHRIYPGEYFNPISASKRVHRAMGRLRLWLDANVPGLTVREQGGWYRLESNGSCALRVFYAQKASGACPLPLKRLEAAWDGQPFSTREAGKILELSPRTTLRLLNDALQQGVVERVGNGGKVHYQFVRRPLKRAS